MDDDAPEPVRQRSPSIGQLSKTPSWIMLGFVLGAAFVAALPPLRQPPPAPAVAPVAPRPDAPPPVRAAPVLTTIEAVFAEWGRHAVWSDDVTEVALWNGQERAFTDFYEVRRVGGVLYFRSIPKLTRRIIARGKPMPEAPLRFTETEEQYQEWLLHGRIERPGEVAPESVRRRE
ncbi:MAG: hypothetical protein JNL92_12975 [Opitutaceae bacterium]|nr:hypothetical protein [Opitutaceae bacterium]